MSADTKVSYQYDQNPSYGWVDIEDRSAKEITIVINNSAFAYDTENYTFSPVCICHARHEGECGCFHLPADFWD